jgi:protein TonB
MSYRTPDNYVEKSLLYLLAGSLLLHAALLVVIINLPEEKKDRRVASGPIIVDLRDLPLSQQASPPRAAQRPERGVAQGKIAPRGSLPKGAPAQDRTPTPPPLHPIPASAVPSSRPGGGETPGLPVPQGRRPTGEPGGESLHRPSAQQPTELARLFPRAERLVKLEENYRRKFRPEVEEGDVAFLNSEDILFGSFLRRFENAVYGVWRYPQEAAQLGIQGVTPVKVSFNRNGEIEQIVLLESSGSTLLDTEVLRTLRAIGPMGALPKGYGRESFTLIAFFRYSIINGAVRGSLH